MVFNLFFLILWQTRVITQIEDVSIARQIKEKRLKLNMTQKELAYAIGMSKYGDRTIKRWENGESNPSILELKQILDFPEKIPFLNNNAIFSMIDLFSGIGGTRLGFHLMGKTKVVFSIEIDKFSIKTYQANFGEVPKEDITKISIDDIPNHDILVDRFPCQAFSQAGKKLGFEDTRGTLFFEIARIISEKNKMLFIRKCKKLSFT